jgi:single-strand DNA-binding protein
MVNKVILVGFIGAEPEVKHISENMSVAKLRIATSESYNDKNGEKVTKTEWHTVVAWRGLATVIEKYVTKGMQVYVEGKLTYSKQEKDGDTRYFTEIVASEIKMLGRKHDGTSSDTQSTASQQHKSNEPDFSVPANFDLSPEPTDDLPFN